MSHGIKCKRERKMKLLKEFFAIFYFSLTMGPVVALYGETQ